MLISFHLVYRLCDFARLNVAAAKEDSRRWYVDFSTIWRMAAFLHRDPRLSRRSFLANGLEMRDLFCDPNDPQVGHPHFRVRSGHAYSPFCELHQRNVKAVKNAEGDAVRRSNGTSAGHVRKLISNIFK